MKTRRLFLLLLMILPGLVIAAEEKEFPDPQKFPVRDSYKPNVRFWIRVYGEWKDNQLALHDAQNTDIVFDVIEVPEKDSLLYSATKPNITKRVEEIKSILLELARDPSARNRSEEHEKFYQLYKDISDPNKFRNAAENIRVQQGIKERFGKGLQQMPQFISQIKSAFREEGVPEEVAYLPLVESSFNNQALSKTRAAGIWQFMSGTARLYMKVNSDLDERLDPVVASRAAARYLKRSYELFGNWPVAIMSYNHGQQGMLKALRTTGSNDFMDILNNYSGRAFGFASRNFYAEFLAACKVMNDAEKYFGTIDYEKPLVSDSIKLANPIWVSTILNQSTLTREELRTYNPALQSRVIFSNRPIPAGYQLRIPAGRYRDLGDFIAQLRGQESRPLKTSALLASAAPITPATASRTTTVRKTYVVRRGDTLFSISRKFSTTVEDIRKRNGLNHNNIFPGQRLTVGIR